MNEVMNCIISRRSVRKLTEQQIPRKVLNQILEAGLYAPSAGGRQGVVLLVCQNKELNTKLGQINKLGFQGNYSTAEVYISKEQPSIADDPSIVSGFYEAPTVVTILGQQRFLYAEQDCAVAAENMMLAAQSFGVASCMIGRAKETFQSELGVSLLEKWKVPNKYVPVCHVLLGYLNGDAPSAKPRKNGRIIFGE